MRHKILGWLFLAPFCSKAQDSVLTESDVIKLALQNNLQIQMARNDVEAATISNNWGFAGRWPTVTAGASDVEYATNILQETSSGQTTKKNGATQNSLNANITGTWKIYNGSLVVATKARLNELQAIGEIALQGQINAVIFDVLTSYYNILRLKEQVKAYRAIIDLSQERYTIASTRFNVGSAAKTDMLQAGIDLNEQKINLISIESQIQKTKAILNTILKRETSTPLDVDSNFVISKLDLGAYAQKVQTNNYDILIARHQLAVLMQEGRQINSQRLPTLSLNSAATYTRTKASAGFFLINQSYGPNIGLGLGIPIYNSNIYKTQARVNKVAQETQQLQIETLSSQVTRDLVNAFTEYDNATQTADIERSNTLLAKENNFISTERFRKLQSNSIELRTAQLSLIDAQDKLINALFRAKLAEISIKLLAGELAIQPESK